jgi:hypothetical protein
MKRFTILAVLAVLSISVFTGCTDNIRAKAYGGTTIIDLPPGQKLVTATWKDADIWYLTRPAKAGETPETLTFKEKSGYGVWEGTVIFKENFPLDNQ